MTAYTSTQAGNWSDIATWGGAGPPGEGDTATILHSVTVAADVTVGTSPLDDVTYGVYVQSGGLLTINTGVTLTCKTNMRLNRTTASTALQINGPGTLQFDGSGVDASRYYTLYCDTNGQINLAGTNTNYATIKAASGSANWKFRSIAATLNSSYGRFQNCDDWLGIVTAAAGQSLSITNTRFENCGVVKVRANSATYHSSVWSTLSLGRKHQWTM